MKLGVNIDHVATLREARGTSYPDILTAAGLALLGGADGITVHLRQDRRHIQEIDVMTLKMGLRVPLNVEISTDEEIVSFIEKIKPDKVCVVPEREGESTTEGGLNIKDRNIFNDVKNTFERLKKVGIEVSLFIEPDIEIIELALDIGVSVIELNTDNYSEVYEVEKIKYIDEEVNRIKNATSFAISKGLIVNAGHALSYENVPYLIKAVPQLNELNIGHAIVCRSVFVGLKDAVKEMKDLLRG